MTDPDRFDGTGSLLVKGVEQSPVQYEITLPVLASAQSADDAQLRLIDGRVLDVTLGALIVTSRPSRAELIVHGGW